jgi:hypothetical protein
VRRLSTQGLTELSKRLSARDRSIIETTLRLRLLSGKQLERLFFFAVERPASRARLTRRALARLSDLDLLGRLERRIGGVRAGAAGYVYYPAPLSQRLIALWHGKGLRRIHDRYEPSRSFARHTLAVSECYVRLVEADRAGMVELLGFEREPVWSFTDAAGQRAVLRPDAFLRLGLDQATELHAFLEIDCGSEGHQALTRKCRTYVAAWRAGISQTVFPKVVWIATSQRRLEVLTEICAAMPAESWRLFIVSTPECALPVLIGTEAGGTR